MLAFTFRVAGLLRPFLLFPRFASRWHDNSGLLCTRRRQERARARHAQRMVFALRLGWRAVLAEGPGHALGMCMCTVYWGFGCHAHGVCILDHYYGDYQLPLLW